MMARLIVLLIASLTVPSLAHAVTAWVSPTGAAAWGACQGATPLAGASACTFTTAMTNGVAGDIIYWRSGTYNMGTMPSNPSLAACVFVKPSNAGTAGNPITHIAYTGETPTITATLGGSSQCAWIGADTNYITYDGFAATIQLNPSSFESTVFAMYGDYGVIKNSTFTGIDIAGDSNNHSFIRVENGDNNTITNNHFNDFYNASGTYVPNSAAIWIFTGSGTLVHNNDCINVNACVQSKTDVLSWEAYRNFVYVPTLNRCQDGFYAGYQGGATTGTFLVHHNVIIGCYNGVRFNAISGTVGASQVYQNTIHAGSQTSGQGIFTGHSGSNVLTNAQYYNNIVSGRVRMFNLSSTMTLAGNGIDYNLFYSASTYAWYLDEGASSATTLAGWRLLTLSSDDNSLTGNPLYVNSDGATAASYQLQAGSPALNVGVGGVDMGAYQGSPCIGASCVTTATSVLSGGARFTGAVRIQ